MRDLEQLLVRLKDWEQFEAVAGSLDPIGKGDLLELLTKHYLLINPAYRTVLSDVWLLDEVPAKVRHELRLPDRDKGIDLIARTRVGGYWTIQSKYRSAAEGSLTWSEISTFAGLAFSVCIGIEFGLIAYTGERYTDVLDEAQHVGFLSRDVWSTLAEEFFDDLSSALAGKRRTLIARDPRPHQRRAIENAETYFEEGNMRGKLIMPCGTEKSLTAFWIAEELAAKTVVIAVPSLALVQQTLFGWLREIAASSASLKVSSSNVSPYTVSSSKAAKDPLPGADAVPIVIGTTSLPCMSNPEVHPESATKIPTN